MLFAIPFPEIDPALVSVTLFGFELAVRWYALAYIAGLLCGWYYVARLINRPHLWAGKPPLDKKAAEDLLTWMVLGVIIGGRLGFIFFYRPDILQNPVDILKVWEGGMSFHGGFLGVVSGVIGYSLLTKRNMISVGDAVAAATPMGLFFGRIANFINGELWGRPTEVSWGVIFPGNAAQTCPTGFALPCARHPSQIYEAALEGLVLFIVITVGIYAYGWLKRPGRVIGMFLFGYGLARTFVEGFRQGDAQFVSDINPYGHFIRIGETADAWGLTMGQILSLPMMGLGLIILILTRKRA